MFMDVLVVLLYGLVALLYGLVVILYGLVVLLNGLVVLSSVAASRMLLVVLTHDLFAISEEPPCSFFARRIYRSSIVNV